MLEKYAWIFNSLKWLKESISLEKNEKVEFIQNFDDIYKYQNDFKTLIYEKQIHFGLLFNKLNNIVLIYRC